jgi:hypothetical protein
VNNYHIPNHVHFAFQPGAVVFLDLRSDRYSLLVGRHASTFKNLCLQTFDSANRTLSPDRLTAPTDANVVQTLITELLENNLLATVKDPRTIPRHTDIVPPSRDLPTHQSARNTTLTMKDAWRVFVSCAASYYRLKRLGIEEIIRAIDSRKTREKPGDSAPTLEIARIVNTYKRLRTLFPVNYLCLFDSLSLLDFLGRHNLYVTLVFAVKLDPWAAHCWLQYGAVILNEDLEEARTYVPIMAV